MEYGFYGCTTHKQALKRIKALAKYDMVEILGEDFDADGFNAQKVQDWLRDYHLSNSMKLLNMFFEKTKKEQKKDKVWLKGKPDLTLNGFWNVAYLMRCKPYWTDLVTELMKHFDVEYQDYQDVCKGLSMVAWFMANDHERNMAKAHKQSVIEGEYHGYITYMALSCACEILGTKRTNKRAEAKLKNDLIFVGHITEEVYQEIKN